MPRSPLAPSADGPTNPGRRRAVIAATTGMASTVGLVLLGIGSAAASIGPSPGPAAGPLPKVPSTSVPDSVTVDLGLPPVPSLAASAGPVLTLPTIPDAAVAPESTPSSIATETLPRAGRAAEPIARIATLTLLAGLAALGLRRRGETPRAARLLHGRRDDR